MNCVLTHKNSSDTSTSNTGGKGLSCSDKATKPVYQAIHKLLEGVAPSQSLPAACELAGVFSLKWRVRWARRLHWKYAEKFSPALAGEVVQSPDLPLTAENISPLS